MCFGCHAKEASAQGKRPDHHLHPNVLLSPAFERANIISKFANIHTNCILSIAEALQRKSLLYEHKINTPMFRPGYNKVI